MDFDAQVVPCLASGSSFQLAFLSFAMSWLFFEHFLNFWYKKRFQAYLRLSLPRDWNQPFSREPPGHSFYSWGIHTFWVFLQSVAVCPQGTLPLARSLSLLCGKLQFLYLLPWKVDSFFFFFLAVLRGSGILLLWPRIKPTPPALGMWECGVLTTALPGKPLEGRFVTTGLPRKSLASDFLNCLNVKKFLSHKSLLTL